MTNFACVPVMMMCPQMHQFPVASSGEVAFSPPFLYTSYSRLKRRSRKPVAWESKRRRTWECLPEKAEGTSMQSSSLGEVEEQTATMDEENEAHIKNLADSMLSLLVAGGDALATGVASAYELVITDKCSSKAVQQVFDRAPVTEKTALALGFCGRIREVALSQHGNHVVQKMIQVMPSSSACFIVEELRGSVGEVAKNRYGCRVLCRLIEHRSMESPAMLGLVEESLADVGDMCRNTFGNYVMSHLLEFGLPVHKERIAVSLCEDMCSNARNRNSGRVIEKALMYCSSKDRNSIVDLYLHNASNLIELAEHAAGCFVVKILLELPEHSQKVKQLLGPHVPYLLTRKYGRKALAGWVSPSDQCIL